MSSSSVASAAEAYLSRPWIARYQAGVPSEMYPSEKLLSQLPREAALYHGSKPAISFLGRVTTYSELWDQIVSMAALFQRHGVKPSDRVALMLPNVPQHVIAFHGALLAGAVVVNTSPLMVGDEFLQQMNDSGATMLVALDTTLHGLQDALRRSALKRVFVARIADALPSSKRTLYALKTLLSNQKSIDLRVKPTSGPRLIDLAEALGQDNGRFYPVRTSPDNLALLQYTGGTTGTPKAAMLTHRNLISNTLQALSWMPSFRKGKEVILGAVPFFHVYGMTVAMNLAMVGAAHLVIVPDPRNLKMLMEQIEISSPTIFPAVPTLYNAINNFCQGKRHRLDSIQICISGSAPLSPDTVAAFSKLTGNNNLVEGYGLTEASPITHVNPFSDRNPPSSIGVPLPGIDAVVMDEDKHPVEIGESGELWVSGPMVMHGYWRRPDETNAALVPWQGKMWLRTGDIVAMDAQGFFYVRDRKKDLIIASGYNIYPREVEEALQLHPDIYEAAVVGVLDAYRGESPHAVVVLKPGASPKDARCNEAALREHCRQHLSPYKVPRSIEYRSTLPKTAIGKVLRRQLQDEIRAKSSGRQGLNQRR